MGTMLGEALARAGLVSKSEADLAERAIVADRKRKENEKHRQQYAALHAEEQAMKERGRVLTYDPAFDEEGDG